MNSWKPVSTFINFTTKGITPKYVKHSSILVLNQKCIRNNRIDYSFAQFTDDTKKIANAKFVKKGDILANSTGVGTAGRIAFVKDLPKEHRLIVDSHILILRCGSFNEAQCLNYALFSFEKTLMSFMTGSSGQSELDKVVLLNLKTKMPTEPESQKAISSVLSTLDAKIKLNNRINEELEGMAKLLYDYWFVQFDFPMTAPQAAALGKPKLEGQPYRASGGKMIYNKTLKREIPEGWAAETLEHVLTLKYGKALKRDIQVPGDYPVYGSGGIYGTHNVPLVKGPGIIVGRKGSVGELYWSNVSFYPTDTSYYVEPKAGVDLNYAYFLLKRLPLKSMNSDSAVPGLSRSAANRLPVTLPDKTVIANFGKFMAPLRANIANNEQQTQELTKLRDWLLPMLMNGQVTVA